MFLFTRKVVPKMKQAERGIIVNIGSIADKHGIKDSMLAYCASRFAVNGFSVPLMEEQRGFGIRVAYIIPGSVNTGFFDHAGIEQKTFMQPDEIAWLIVLLVQVPDGTLPD